MKFYLIGIGGAGMSVVAHLLKEQGYSVSGSDTSESSNVIALRENQITVHIGHDAKNVPTDAIVVVSTAIKRTNPEYAFAVNNGNQIWHRSKALAFAARSKQMIAVAGTHGKTTTSGMLAYTLSAAGLDPSYAVGSTIAGLGVGAKLGDGEFFVAEADESDKSFLNYEPKVAVVTNLEADHLDNYKDIAELEEIFYEFTQRVLPDGYLVICRDDPGSLKLAEKAVSERKVFTYGTSQQIVQGEAGRIEIQDIKLQAGKSLAKLVLHDFSSNTMQIFNLELSVAGKHNVLNATAAVAVAYVLNLKVSDFVEHLAGFAGTGRRFELRGQVCNVRIYDDYAHHPTEVRAALEQARLYAGSGRVVAIFQPHLYSRTLNFATEFAQSLALADFVVVVDIYAAREEPVEGVDSSVITSKMDPQRCQYIPSVTDAVYTVANWVCDSDVIVTIGAGDITQAGNSILEFLQGELF